MCDVAFASRIGSGSRNFSHALIGAGHGVKLYNPKGLVIQQTM